MTMIAKFSGKCKKCGQEISVGEQINWEKGKGAQHITCPAVEVLPDNVISISVGSGCGGQPYTIGQVLRKKREGWPDEGKILIVLQKGQHYHREEGMSFGVGDESGYVYWAKCREATLAEANSLLARERTIKRICEAKNAIRRVIEEIQTTGERPEGQNTPCGQQLYGKRDIYGGGEWFVVGKDFIWWVENNGMDGDNWSANNVRTGGAGAIGWRVPFEQGLAEQIVSLCKILQPQKEEEEFNQKLAEHLEQGGREY